MLYLTLEHTKVIDEFDSDTHLGPAFFNDELKRMDIER